ncbi:Uncharacterized protein dnm_009500 [Desulfonema magnum]|uniref:Uncharacterized protein n=1 Tax=Desulfonema magnum TaxID=45655 RepID=A0A975BGE5_9BACT|nr:Uncharacterized protein dnm_009500 [Desulfonema magnum]
MNPPRVHPPLGSDWQIRTAFAEGFFNVSGAITGFTEYYFL